jgi:hypothetical protein
VGGRQGVLRRKLVGAKAVDKALRPTKARAHALREIAKATYPIEPNQHVPWHWSLMHEPWARVGSSRERVHGRQPKERIDDDRDEQTAEIRFGLSAGNELRKRQSLHVLHDCYASRVASTRENAQSMGRVDSGADLDLARNHGARLTIALHAAVEPANCERKAVGIGLSRCEHDRAKRTSVKLSTELQVGRVDLP